MATKPSQSEFTAWYRPNGFLITLSEGIATFDPAGLKFKDEDGFSVAFHEYVHYLQNIATPSGFHSFKLAFEFWRLFRETVDEDGASGGPGTLSPEKQQWLDQFLDIFDAIEGDEEPDWIGVDFVADEFEIDRVTGAAEQRHLGNIVTEVTNLTIRGRALDAETGQSESYVFRLGATAISEGIAFELDQIVASGQSGQRKPGNSAPPFPYHVLRKLAERECQGITVGSVLALGCLSLLWNDPTGELIHLFDLYNQRVQAGAAPDEAIRQIVRSRLPDITSLIHDILTVDIPALENELQALGSFERGMVRILGRFRRLLTRRADEPLLELSALDDDGTISFARARDLLESIPICMVILTRAGSEDALARDLLLSSDTSLQPAEADDELALLYSAFDFCAVHQWHDGFRSTKDAGEHRCPFYTCCTLRMRIDVPDRCRTHPWSSATWPGWPEGHTCWYGAAAKRLSAGNGSI